MPRTVNCPIPDQVNLAHFMNMIVFLCEKIQTAFLYRTNLSAYRKVCIMLRNLVFHRVFDVSLRKNSVKEYTKVIYKIAFISK